MPNQERLRETKHHGAVRFPFNIYPCTIPGDFLQVPLHWHDSMELVYVKKGSGIVQVGVNAYPAEQGDIYIFAPGTLHALHQRGQAVMEYENIIFELELLGGADDLCAERYLLPLQSGRMALQPRIIPGEAGYPQAAACLQEAEKANKVKTAGYELAIKGALLRFLSILIGQHGTPLPEDTTDTRRLKTVLQLIEAEYATPLRIEDAALPAGLSDDLLVRITATWARFSGCTPGPPPGAGPAPRPAPRTGRPPPASDSARPSGLSSARDERPSCAAGTRP